MKTIYLARHAKSSWNTGFDKDFDRPLSFRGETDAIKMGEEMQRLSWVPEKIISSPALRAKQTCKSYCEVLNYSEENVEWNADIYEAYTITLLQLLTGLNENIQSVMLIGHNPAMEDLLVHLCGYSQVSEWQQKDGKIFTTANIAKLTTSTSIDNTTDAMINTKTNTLWKHLAMDQLHLEKLLRPKEIS